MPFTVGELAGQESPIMGAKYISAAALSCLLYDHGLHFNDELTDIWINFWRGPILKLLYLLGRYSAIVTVIYTAQSQAIFNMNITPHDCQVWAPVTVILIGLTMIGTEGIVIYRLRSLWQFNPPITRAIVALAIVVFISSVISMSMEAVQVKKLFQTVEGVPGCLFISSSSEPLIPSVVLGVGFVIWDIFTVCIFTFNTFAAPYLRSSDILHRFRRDGGRYFLYLLVTHSLLLFSSTFGRNSRISVIPLVIALSTIINSRIFHGIALEAEHYADEYNATFLIMAG